MTNSPLPPSTVIRRLAGERLCLLLVDDDPDDLFLAGDSLQAVLPCDIQTTSTGRGALTQIMANAGEFHAVLLDNGLPDMAGLDVLAQVRAEKPHLPIVLVTGYGSEAVVVNALRRGANDYVVKSGDYLQVLPEVVAQVIERERLRRRAEHLEAEHLRFAQMAAVGEMAAGIAHEIRNPMQVISGMASLIQENHGALQAEDLERCAQAIVDNCRHLNHVLEEVLQNAHATPARAPLQLRAVLEETLSFMQFDMEWRHGMMVETEFHSDGAIIGDRDHLKQVLINLFRNAQQAVQMAGKKHGRLRVVVRESTCSQGAREVIAQISDDGIGIAASAIPHIFDSGFSTKGRTAPIKGSGLGLSICRRIVEEHDGQLWAENNPNGGASFFVALPLAPIK